MGKLGPGEHLSRVRGRPQAQGHQPRTLPTSTEEPGVSMSTRSQECVCEGGWGGRAGAGGETAQWGCCSHFWVSAPLGVSPGVQREKSNLASMASVLIINNRMSVALAPSLQSHARLDPALRSPPWGGHQGDLMPKTLASSEVPPLPEILFPIFPTLSSATPYPESLFSSSPSGKRPNGEMAKRAASGNIETKVQVSARLLTSCVALSSRLNLSEPWLSQ